MPTFDDEPVEEQIRVTVKDLLRTRNKLRHTGLVQDANGSLKVPYMGLKNKLSLQVICSIFV